jgi:ABC-type transport system involved in cytochrome c biogenesis permease subunit
MSTKSTDAESFMSDALLFLAISLVLFTLLFAITVPTTSDIWIQLLRRGVYFILSVIASASAIRISWLMVGGKASFLSYFTTSAYFLGVSFVLLSLVMAMYAGTIKSFYPTMSQKLLKETNMLRMFSETEISEVHFPDDGMGVTIALLVFFVGFLAIMIWSYIAWGVYGQLNNTTRWRSIIAAIISTALSFVFMIPVVLVDVAFMGNK